MEGRGNRRHHLPTYLPTYLPYLVLRSIQTTRTHIAHRVLYGLRIRMCVVGASCSSVGAMFRPLQRRFWGLPIIDSDPWQASLLALLALPCYLADDQDVCAKANISLPSKGKGPE
ncbi:hypothetical protein LX32DRAFT_76098 [Colletotrichum zoysiae]|uniref:Uncharacterized protein n=1 Tax=Colletotrichum zoysiae TaxID=1216348 RepID=A0AAD9HBQ5_9PEZI|nr:hypothetical protein LX32DRAFT_76098 [Colletotrichum zoysiae]